MKKAVVVALSLVAFLCLLAVAFHLYITLSRPHEKTNSEIVTDLQADREKAEREIIGRLVAGLDDNNGAEYYLMACQALVSLPDEDPMWKSIDGVIDSGWQKDDSSLEAFMEKNEPAIDLAVKGTKQGYCSMSVENMTDDLAYFHGLRQIGRLFVVKAKYLEKKQQYEAEGKLYGDFLRFAADVTDMGTMIHALVGIAVTSLAYHSMNSYVSNLNDEILCGKLLGEMVEIERNRSPLHDLLEREFTCSRKLYKNLGNEYLYTGNLPEKSGVGQRFISSAVRRVGYLWFRIRMPGTLKKMEEAHQIILEESKKPYLEILRGRFEDRVPKNELIRIWLPTTRKFILSMARHDAVRRGNIVKVALRLHYLKSGDYPETLEQLLPLMPEKILTDPLSGKRFVYRKAGGEYLFYGFGTDMDDDGGKEIQPRQVDDGDIVFQSTQTPHNPS